MLHPGLHVSFTEGGHIVRALADRYDHEPTRDGLHCSTIVNDYMKTLYPAKYRDNDGSITTEQRHALWEFGNAYEDVVARELHRRIRRWRKPEPREHRGIWFSPDGWRPGSRTIDEVKATWVSRREFLDSPKFLAYLLQGLCYAHVWQARRLMYHILFVVADYKSRAPFPIPMTAVVTWDDEADADVFDRVRQHAIDRAMLKAA